MSSVQAERGLVARGEPSRLFGRELELALISNLLEHVGAGGGSLLVHGEPGIGKSALLVEARRQAERLGMPVLSTAGTPFERQMPFAGLHRLLRPLLHQATSLPEPQRAALSVAFGVRDGPAPDTFLIALAALEILADRAGEAGLVVLVEDVHWLAPEAASNSSTRPHPGRHDLIFCPPSWRRRSPQRCAAGKAGWRRQVATGQLRWPLADANAGRCERDLGIACTV
jgi:hypothetical protein